MYVIAVIGTALGHKKILSCDYSYSPDVIFSSYSMGYTAAQTVYRSWFTCQNYP